MPFKFNPLTGKFDLVNAAGAGGGVAISGSTNSQSTGTVNFSNSNGVSFGLNTNGVMTATVQTNYLTTAMASNRGSDFVQATAAFAGTSASGTIASNGISVSVGPYITTAMASNRGTDFVQANAGFAGTSASGTIASNGISVSIGPYITTGALSNHSHGVSFTSGSVGFQTLSFTNSNGISFNSGTQGIFGSHNAITTGALSDHSHGNPTLALTNLTGTTASASNGFTLSLSAAAPGAGGGFAAQGSGAYTQNTGTIQWANSNGITFGLSTNQMTASHNGLTTAALSNHSHAASASNGSFDFQTINFSNANNVTFGTSAGGIITASVAAPGGGADKTASFWEINNGIQSTAAIWNNATFSNRPIFFPFQLEKAITAISSIRIYASRTGGTSALVTLFAGIYTIANSTSMNLVSSTSFNISVTTSAQFSGIRGLNFTGLGAMSLSPGQYVFGLQASMPASASWGMNIIGHNSLALAGWLLPGTNSTAATDSASRLFPFCGVWNATSAGLPSAVGTVSISGGNGANSPKPYFAFLAIP